MVGRWQLCRSCFALGIRRSRSRQSDPDLIVSWLVQSQRGLAALGRNQNLRSTTLVATIVIMAGYDDEPENLCQKLNDL